MSRRQDREDERMRMVAELQRRFIFFPDTTRVGSVQRYFRGARDVAVDTEDGLRLGAWLVPPSRSDRGVAVLFLPGNGGNRESRAGLFGHLAARGFTVLGIDYRGYGGNPGAPSEAGVAADARAAAAFLRREGFAPQRTLYVGESLGCAVAARLASTDQPAGLVLRSPFTSLVDVARAHYGPVAMLALDRFPVADLLRRSAVPVTVIHGAADDIVPAALSKRVAASAANLHEELAIPGAGHNDPVMYGSVVADAVARLADAVT